MFFEDLGGFRLDGIIWVEFWFFVFEFLENIILFY